MLGRGDQSSGFDDLEINRSHSAGQPGPLRRAANSCCHGGGGDDDGGNHPRRRETGARYLENANIQTEVIAEGSMAYMIGDEYSAETYITPTAQYPEPAHTCDVLGQMGRRKEQTDILKEMNLQMSSGLRLPSQWRIVVEDELTQITMS